MLSDSLPTAPADVLVIPMDEAQQGYAISVATQLRTQGVRTQIYCERKKFKAKISYAAKLGIPFALFLGGDEEAAGSVTYKDLTSGQQKTADFAAAAADILAELEKRSAGKVIGE